MSRIVGIDLGTTNSLVAVVDAGFPGVLADAAGRRLTPSVVHVAADGAVTVGEPARRRRALEPAQTVASVKRFIGRRPAEVPAGERDAGHALVDDGGALGIPLPGRLWRPEEISAEVLKKLKADAEAALGEPVSRAVITVPAHFHDAQRQATIRAGELAGLTVERLVNEPTAAALAYGLDRLRDRAKIAVYDLGGGTFDLSILKLNEGVFQVLATHGDTRLGGDDLDRRVTECLAGRVRAAGGPDLRRAAGILPALIERDADFAGKMPAARSALARLREAAEDAKIRLSTETEAEIALPFLTPDFSFSCRLTRAELEELTRDILGRTRGPCLRALADARLEPRELEQVILVGGQTRMPLVRRLVAEWFGCRDFAETRGNLRLGDAFHRPDGPELNTSVNPDEAVALGAAVQAAILEGGFRQVLLLDVTPLSLGLETFGGLMNVLIPRNTTIPVKAGELFTTAVDGQREMLIHVLQGERERARDNWSLGRFTLEFEPAPKGVPRVGVQFELDASGVLRVLARDTRTGRERVVEMKSAVDVDDAAVQRMVEESVEHAFDDLHARRWIEAKLRAGEVAAATRHALAELGGEVAADRRAAVEAALRDVEAALAAEDPATQAGDPARLKAAVQALDTATQPLAERLMDRAMEAMLRQQGLLK
jgi:molecular chaperone DnaK